MEVVIFPPLNGFSIFVKTVGHIRWPVSEFSVLFHQSMCLFLFITHILDYCSYKRNLKIKLTDLFHTLLSFLKRSLAILFLCLPGIKLSLLGMNLFVSVETLVGTAFLKLHWNLVY